MNRITTSEAGAEELIPTRKSLIGRLRDWEDQESWREFFDTYWKLVYRFSLQRGLTHPEAEEVVQETVLAVARSIGRFEYQPAKCAFKTWLLTVTRSKIANQLEKRARRERSFTSSADLESERRVETIPDDQQQEEIENAWDEEWRQNITDRALERVKERVSIEQFQMFDLFVMKSWPAREVAKTLGVTVAHVYVAKHRITKLIRQTVAVLEKSDEDGRILRR